MIGQRATLFDAELFGEPGILCYGLLPELTVLYAQDDPMPLLLYGCAEDDWMCLLPKPLAIRRHRIAFARFCHREIERFRGKKLWVKHSLDPCGFRFAMWLGIDVTRVPQLPHVVL